MPSYDKLVDSVYAQLAVRIREERKKRGMSALTLAQGAGLSHQMVGYIERGVRNPSLGTLIRVAQVLELDLPAIIAQAMRGR